MFRVALALALIAPPLAAGPPTDAHRRKAKAALALAFAEPAPPTYAEQYAKAVRGGVPLVVWVRQPPLDVPGAVGVRRDEFPGVAGAAVVIGVPAADGLRRIDLPGVQTAAAVRQAAAGAGGGRLPDRAAGD